MAKTNHVNFADPNGKVYCFRYNTVAVLDDLFVKGNCEQCPYFNGSAQGGGVECLYADGTNRSIVQQYDPYEAMREAQEGRGKLGMLSEFELTELQGKEE